MNMKNIWLVVTGTMEFDWTFQKHLGMEKSSQLRIRPSFFRGLGLNHQPDEDLKRWMWP
jgi:hypothetical protein